MSLHPSSLCHCLHTICKCKLLYERRSSFLALPIIWCFTLCKLKFLQIVCLIQLENFWKMGCNLLRLWNFMTSMLAFPSIHRDLCWRPSSRFNDFHITRALKKLDSWIVCSMYFSTFIRFQLWVLQFFMILALTLMYKENAQVQFSTRRKMFSV